MSTRTGKEGQMKKVRSRQSGKISEVEKAMSRKRVKSGKKKLLIRKLGKNCSIMYYESHESRKAGQESQYQENEVT